MVDEGTACYNKGDAAGFVSLYADDIVLTTPEGDLSGSG
jgi:hypothetical protein